MSKQTGGVGLLVRRMLGAGWFGVAAVPFVLPGAGAPPGPRAEPLPGEGLKAPGDCTSERHGVLQQDVRAKCDSQKMSCLKPDTCDDLERKIKLFDGCINARKAINTECFRGGDSNHNKEIGAREKGKTDCEEQLKTAKKKGECKPPEFGKCPVKRSWPQ